MMKLTTAVIVGSVLAPLALLTAQSAAGAASATAGGAGLAATRVAVTRVAVTPPPARASLFDLVGVTTGTGQLLPHRIRRLDAFGQPTSTVLDITDLAVLRQNLSAVNPVLPVATWPVQAVLPNGAPGNQFLSIRFTLSLDPAATLQGAVSFLAYRSGTGVTTRVPARLFAGGETYFGSTLVRAVVRSGNGITVLDPRALGFPQGFAGAGALADPEVAVFVADSDNDLTTFETFPAGVDLRLVIEPGPYGQQGLLLDDRIVVASAVGSSAPPPELLGGAGAATTPPPGATMLPPGQRFTLHLSSAVQPYDLGYGSDGLVPAPSAVEFVATVGAARLPIPCFGEPDSWRDLCDWHVRPAHQLPGASTIDLSLVGAAAVGLNGQSATNGGARFSTGPGPGVVNAPVAPEAIYVGQSVGQPGIGVIDLDGFGQGTGDPAISNFPANPNVGAAGVFPALIPGATSLDAGGAGPLTLTRDSNLGTQLVDPSVVASVVDLQIGQSLDLIFNNTGINVQVSSANQVNPATMLLGPGNTIEVAPHPNPPRIVLPPPNPARLIVTEEPTVTTSVSVPGRVTTTAPPAIPSPLNLLVPGPNGLFAANHPGVFYGPQPAPPSPPPPPFYAPFTSRQQIGHFLFAADRIAGEIVVLNSNRMTVLARIPVPDPTDLAMAPSLDRLAVSSFATDTVFLIDADPSSSTFLQAVARSLVGHGPRGIAWQPEGEDLLVCNAREASLTILDGRTFTVRRTVRGAFGEPVDVAVGARQVTTGFRTGTWFAYVLSSDGTVTIVESGPAPWGADDAVQVTPAWFAGATSIQPAIDVASGCWIAHRDARGVAQLSLLELTRSPVGPQPVVFDPNNESRLPWSRGRVWAITRAIGGAAGAVRLSGRVPVDVAFDDLTNEGGALDVPSLVVPGLPSARHSGKGHLKMTASGVVPATLPRLAFVAFADTGKVDVIDLGTGALVRTLDVPGVTCLAHYWRQ
ncbi:MAG: hypothetical protein IPM29_28260 [Planctomycetes bacterium]|nr:hypothetical protein [Planctomycetota bacterium]